MSTLDSPIEALAFHNLSFFISALTCNIWAWLAAATAAASYFWRLKADDSSRSRACVVENHATKETVAATPLVLPSVKFTARYDEVELQRNACCETAASGGESDKTVTDGGFCGGEDWWCDEPVVACYETTVVTEKASLKVVSCYETTVVAEKASLKVFSVADSSVADYDVYWKAILGMRNGDSIGQCHDTARVLDGNIVKLWDRYSEGCIASRR